MIHRSELGGFPLKNGLTMIEKVKNVQRKTLKDHQKVWRAIDQDFFKKLQECLAVWKQK